MLNDDKRPGGAQRPRSLNAGVDSVRVVASAPDALAELEASLTWARPTGYAPPMSWHRVVSIGPSSVTTTCAGRWSLLDPYETCADPPVAERCGGCTRVDDALAELRHAPVIETSRVPVLFEAWDYSDEHGGES